MSRPLAVLALLTLSLGFAAAATVTGTVVGTEGKPATGAVVYLRLYDARQYLELRCDAAGHFTVEADLQGKPANELIAYVLAYAPGYTITDAQLKANGRVVHENQDLVPKDDSMITLDAGGTISGTVVNTDGTPLAGVPVRLTYSRARAATTCPRSGGNASPPSARRTAPGRCPASRGRGG